MYLNPYVSKCRPRTDRYNYVRISGLTFNEFGTDPVKDVHMTAMLII